jgi:hypothetical protein
VAKPDTLCAAWVCRRFRLPGMTTCGVHTWEWSLDLLRPPPLTFPQPPDTVKRD